MVEEVALCHMLRITKLWALEPRYFHKAVKDLKCREAIAKEIEALQHVDHREATYWKKKNH